MINFEGATAIEAVDIDAITITGGQQITTDNGTLQFTASVSPADATQKYIWKISNVTGEATISKDGLVTAIKDGTVKVEAVSSDDLVSSKGITVTISGQIFTLFEKSYIKDGDFNLGVGNALSSYWFNPDGITIVDGVAQLKNPTVGVNPWDKYFGQTLFVPYEDKDLDYIIQFKAWAETPRTFTVDIEDIKNGWARFGITSDEFSLGGISEWKWDLTNEPTVYTFHVNLASMLPDADVKLNFMAGQDTPLVYLDSIIFVKSTDITSAKALSANSMKVYPNPVGNANELTVNLTSINAKVAIYNSLGQKMMEKVANGNMAKFNVSSLHKGMYFIRLNDGTTQKFIR
jgi:hypothetical protein